MRTNHGNILELLICKIEICNTPPLPSPQKLWAVGECFLWTGSDEKMRRDQGCGSGFVSKKYQIRIRSWTGLQISLYNRSCLYIFINKISGILTFF